MIPLTWALLALAAARAPAPGDAAPGDAAPGDAAPGDAAPGDAAPGDAAPGDAAPGAATLRCRLLARCRHFDAHRYIVDDNEVDILYNEEDGYLSLSCNGSDVLKSPAMPRADRELAAWQVVVTNCRLPAAASVLDRLRWLNVTVLFNETHGKLSLQLPSSTLLTEQHFAGLQRLSHLEIRGLQDNRVGAKVNFLAPLESLRVLDIESVKLPSGEPNATSALEVLSVKKSSVERLPNSSSSSSLVTLTVESDIPLDAGSVPPRLQTLDLKSPATTLLVSSVPHLNTLSLANWTEPRPWPLTSCLHLTKIRLTAPAARELPNHWLANCPNLNQLVIEKARNLYKLPKILFGKLNSVIALVAIKEGVLQELNEGQFNESINESEMEQLELNGNRLRTIPRDVLSSKLIRLDLSSNNLNSSVLEAVAAMLAENLADLNLGDNPRLGDLCGEDGYSAIRELDTIKKLSLRKTRVSRVCRDWRENMPLLKELDLRDSAVSTLTFDDLQFTKRPWQVQVLLQGAPVTLLQMTSEDLERAKETSSGDVFFHLDDSARFRCDCHMYWTRRVLETSPYILRRIGKMNCSDGKLLTDLMAENMVCSRREECADRCTCSERPDDEPTWDRRDRRDRRVVRVNCTRAGLHRVPRLPPANDTLYELLLSHNHIVELSARDLDNVKILDLSYNLITQINEETALKLGNVGGSVRLAGNLLECGCSAAPLLLAVRALAARGGVDDVTCDDGARAGLVDVVECPPSVAGYVGGLAALSALAVAAVACLASRERRFFAKAVLVRWGCRCWLDADDDDRRYDAFVTYSHKDEDVVRELMSRLEPPYRLCVHRRDWVPGLRIPEQIVASVRESRRTVALVSRHFLASTWTRAEFREAHEAAMAEARPRLLVVLLEEPAALALDDQLQRYIATHTYLRWGEPWFYHKLAVALPRPRPPRSVREAAPFEPSAVECSTPTPLQFEHERERERTNENERERLETTHDATRHSRRAQKMNQIAIPLSAMKKC